MSRPFKTILGSMMAENAGVWNWAIRNRLALMAAMLVLAYAGFVQWIWGWPSVLAAWRDVGVGRLLLALALLVGTYLVRAHRIADYFPREIAGRFLRLFRVTQIHNILNIMMPFRAGETSFPLLMRSEFGVPLAQGTSALLVLRLLDLHALLAAAGIGLVAGAGFAGWAWLLWLAFLISPLAAFPFRHHVLKAARARMPQRLVGYVDEIGDGIPHDLTRFLRAWLLTVLNWGVKVAALAWVLGLMGVGPLAACFGGALGGELSSVLPLHAPGGVGTYPAGIVAGALAFGADKDALSLSGLATASISAHLVTIVSALAGTGISLLLPVLAGVYRRRSRNTGASRD
jgi:uncharacterized membrane protein YbhN (UPF0104 family)